MLMKIQMFREVISVNIVEHPRRLGLHFIVLYWYSVIVINYQVPQNGA